MQGKTINGFTLQHQLGVGGMAEVWYAENEIHKAAAVKMLSTELSNNDQIVERFRTEAEIMVKLNHPNIRQVYGYGSIDGRPAIIMEYLEGEDLKARMKRGQHFTDEELKKWWNQLVSALNYTHQKGIVHRDIKPGNIFVDRDGNIKLLDFGIAKVRESISSTQTGQKLGTLMYMSPEQVKDSKHIDYRTDVYSLAVTFVHLLTGKKPYDSDTNSDFEISESIVYKPLDLSAVPSYWCDILTPYLRKEANSRPALRPLEDNSKTIGATAGDDETSFEGTSKINNQNTSRGSYAEEQERRRLARQQAQPTTNIQTNPVQKERHGFVTFWFGFMIVGNIISFITSIIAYAGSARYDWYYGWVYLCSAPLSILNIFAVVLLFKWKKKGFYMLLVISACSFLTVRPSIWLSLISVIILWAILQIKKNGVSCWKQLE